MTGVMRRIATLTAAMAMGAAAAVAPLTPAPPAGASNHAVCQLLAAGNTPEQVARSTAVQQMLGGNPTQGEAMVFVRSVVEGQCPQFLWRF